MCTPVDPAHIHIVLRINEKEENGAFRCCKLDTLDSVKRLKGRL